MNLFKNTSSFLLPVRLSTKLFLPTQFYLLLSPINYNVQLCAQDFSFWQGCPLLVIMIFHDTSVEYPFEIFTKLTQDTKTNTINELFYPILVILKSKVMKNCLNFDTRFIPNCKNL